MGIASTEVVQEAEEATTPNRSSKGDTTPANIPSLTATPNKLDLPIRACVAGFETAMLSLVP